MTRASLLGGALPPGFARRTVALRPGGRLTYRSSQWRDAIVAIDSGEIHLLRAGQPSCSFRQGDLVSLGGLGLTAIYNPGPELALLIVVWRRPPDRPH